MSNIRPIMEYGDVIWAGGNQTDLDGLDMVQKDAAIVIAVQKKMPPPRTILQDCEWSITTILMCVAPIAGS